MGIDDALERARIYIEAGADGIMIHSRHKDGAEIREFMRRFRPDLEDPRPEDVVEGFSKGKLLDVPWIDPIDVANAVLFLASDEARYITGVHLPIDAGSTIKWG
jgi:2-methylisocitrate lyase-like PEP mutase family enzyme